MSGGVLVPFYIPRRQPDGARWLERLPDSETRTAIRERDEAQRRVMQKLTRERQARDRQAVAGLRDPGQLYVYRDSTGPYIEVPLEEHPGGGYERLILRLPDGAVTTRGLGDLIRTWLVLLTAKAGPREWADPATRNRAQLRRQKTADRYAFELLKLERGLEERAGFADVLFGGQQNWTDEDRIPPERLMAYLSTAVAREAAKSRDPRIRPPVLGGQECRELDAPLPSDPTRTKAEVLLPQARRDAAERELAASDNWHKLEAFAFRTRSESLRRMALLLREHRDKEVAIELYGKGGPAAFKRLQAELRDSP